MGLCLFLFLQLSKTGVYTIVLEKESVFYWLVRERMI